MTRHSMLLAIMACRTQLLEWANEPFAFDMWLNSQVAWCSHSISPQQWLNRVYLTGGLKKPREFRECWLQPASPGVGPVLSVPFEEVSQLVKRHSTEPLQHIPSWSCHCLLAAFSVDPKAKCLRTSLEVLEMPRTQLTRHSFKPRHSKCRHNLEQVCFCCGIVALDTPSRSCWAIGLLGHSSLCCLNQHDCICCVLDAQPSRCRCPVSNTFSGMTRHSMLLLWHRCSWLYQHKPSLHHRIRSTGLYQGNHHGSLDLPMV